TFPNPTRPAARPVLPGVRRGRHRPMRRSHRTSCEGHGSAPRSRPGRSGRRSPDVLPRASSCLLALVRTGHLADLTDRLVVGVLGRYDAPRVLVGDPALPLAEALL